MTIQIHALERKVEASKSDFVVFRTAGDKIHFYVYLAPVHTKLGYIFVMYVESSENWRREKTRVNNNNSSGRSTCWE